MYICRIDADVTKTNTKSMGEIFHFLFRVKGLVGMCIACKKPLRAPFFFSAHERKNVYHIDTCVNC